METHIQTGRKLFEEVLAAKTNWQRAKLERERAAAEYDYARTRLVLARSRLQLEMRMLSHDERYDVHLELMDFEDDLHSVRFVGMPIGEALKSALSLAKSMSTEQLVGILRSGGFEFTADAPAREVHAALVKQQWAKKNEDSKEWAYVSDEIPFE